MVGRPDVPARSGAGSRRRISEDLRRVPAAAEAVELQYRRGARKGSKDREANGRGDGRRSEVEARHYGRGAAGSTRTSVTWTMASSWEWLIVTNEPVAPSFSNRRAAPSWNCRCGGPWRRTTSMPRQNTPCECPVPSAFIAASLAAKRAANDEAKSRLRWQ